MKYIFVDLDETLFHARFLGTKDPERTKKTLRKTEKMLALKDAQDVECECYGSTLRPGALELLKALRQIPDSKVLVLTSSTEDYAKANNEIHGLGFADEDIFMRSNLQNGTHGRLESLDLVRTPMYLIDNLTRGENRIKVWWLERLTDIPIKYIQVSEFLDLDQDPPFDQGKISAIVDTILSFDEDQ